jgi:alkylation response protein AidB-like acyl-CoA dehydrogenase
MAPVASSEHVPAPFHGPSSTKAGNASRIQADPQLVAYPTYSSDPSTPEEFYTRAKEVSDLLAQDAHIRDRGNVVPHRQVQLLKDAGLVTLLGPKEAGGAGQTWSVAYRVVRIIAQGEGSLGQLLGYHYIWFWTSVFVGLPEQDRRIRAWLTQNKYFLGGAVNPRDADLQAVLKQGDPSKLVFNGKKTFSTGSKVSDVTILEGALPDGTHIFAPVLSSDRGIVYGDEWVDTLGMRATQSGGITITNVEVDVADALGYVDGQFRALGPFNTLILPAIQVSLNACDSTIGTEH